MQSVRSGRYPCGTDGTEHHRRPTPAAVESSAAQVTRPRPSVGSMPVSLRGRRRCVRGRDERIDLGLEHGKGDRAVLQDRVVEFPQVKAHPQRFFGAGSQLADLELTHLVAERLARPSYVAVGLGTNLVE